LTLVEHLFTVQPLSKSLGPIHLVFLVARASLCQLSARLLSILKCLHVDLVAVDLLLLLLGEGNQFPPLLILGSKTHVLCWS